MILDALLRLLPLFCVYRDKQTGFNLTTLSQRNKHDKTFCYKRVNIDLDWRDRGLLVSQRQATWSCCWSVWTWASTDERVNVPLSSCWGRGVEMIACRNSTTVGSLCVSGKCWCAGVDLSSLRTETDAAGSLSDAGWTTAARFCRFLLRASFSAKAFCWAPAIASLTASNRRSSASWIQHGI